MTLVSIPWQPGFKVTPDTLALLQRACQLKGGPIYVDDAWRSYDEQLYYWNRYITKAPGWTIASNPNDPKAQNNHRRAAAVDIVDKNDRKYMLAVGFTPDANEWWHFNNPNWPNMPIIDVDTSPAAYNALPLPTIITPVMEYDMNSLVTYKFDPATGVPAGFVVIDHVNKRLRVVDDKVSTEYNVLLNLRTLIIKQGGSMTDLSQDGWLDLIKKERGFTRIW